MFRFFSSFSTSKYKKTKKEKKASPSLLLFLSLPLPLPQQQHRIQHQGGLSAGGGISAQAAADGALPGFIGSASFSQRNLFGLGQKLAATLEVGQVDKLFRINHSDPWILGDPFRTSRVCSLQNTRSSGAPIYGAATLEEEEYFGGGGGGGNGGGGNGGDYLSPSSSSSYFPSDSNAGALDPSGQYAGSPSRSTAAVAAANAADAESPIIISRLTGESRVFSCFFSFFTSFSTPRNKKTHSLFSSLSSLSLSSPFLHLDNPNKAASSTPARSPWAGREPWDSAGSAPRPSTRRGGRWPRMRTALP